MVKLEVKGSIINRTYQNCKQLFIYMNNWDKDVALEICPAYLVLVSIEYQTELLSKF